MALVKGSITTPSAVNVYDFSIDFGSELNTSNAPFELFTVDECGQKKDKFDLTDAVIGGDILFNKCVKYSFQSSEVIIGTGEESNKFYLNTTSLNLPVGVFDYVIYFVDGSSIIKGKLNILDF